ncbi:cytochrome P450 [Pseudomonas sp. GM49]|jgi:cytochrome P450|uniref:cytochrome P450 n=1 Tax=Pseudomonas sp. GM49 TaxID=1144331 RepID=UPI000270C86B|nr:cytochrome P450 [Pseudomonas sp. GM49]EJM70006.1 cytochrome P450 [Pseudomonas sp. GM49]
MSRIDVDSINLADLNFWKRHDREEAFAALRANKPVTWSEFPEGSPEYGSEGFWSVTRYDDVVAVSGDAKTFISGQGTILGDQSVEEAHQEGWFLNMDAPQHFKLRQVVARAFSPQGVAKMTDAAKRYAVEVVAAAKERGECDYARDVAQAFPVEVVCDFLGAPKENRKRLHELTVTALAGDTLGENAIPAITSAFAELNDYGRQLAVEKRKNPGDDILSLILAAEVEGKKLNDVEAGYFFQLLVTAGMETTGTVGAHAMKCFLEFPDQMKIWANNPAAVAVTGFEELVRWVTPVMHMRRTATRDTEINGQHIAEGQKVVMWYNSANRDDSKFENPNKFDVLRSPNPHLGFGGGGRHTCLGAHLARLELPFLIAETLKEFKNIELTAEPEMIPSRFINGIASLPIRFTAA